MKTKRLCDIELVINTFKGTNVSNIEISKMTGVTPGQIRRIKKKLGYAHEKRGRKLKS